MCPGMDGDGALEAPEGVQSVSLISVWDRSCLFYLWSSNWWWKGMSSAVGGFCSPSSRIGHPQRDQLLIQTLLQGGIPCSSCSGWGSWSQPAPAQWEQELSLWVVTLRECCPSLEGKLLETETIVQETKEIVSIATQVPSGNCSWELLEIRGFVLSAALGSST